MRHGRETGRAAKRLLFLINDPDFFCSHRRPLAVGALKAGYHVWLASPPGDSVFELESLGVRHVALTLERASTNPFRELIVINEMRRIVQRVRPDIMHSITMKPVLYGGVVGRALRVPLTVSAISGLGYMFLAEGKRAAMLRSGVMTAFRAAIGGPRNRVIFQNPSDRDLFLQSEIVDPKHVRMIPGSGTDLAAFQPGAEAEGPPVVLLPARMLWDKGVREFVEAAERLKERGLDARFILSGKTDTQNPAAVPTTKLEDWNREGIVEWVGHTSNIAELLSESHIVVLPSYREGFPKSLIDAAAAGRAVVTTDVPGCRDAIEDGVTGLLVPPKDSERLADAIEKLLVDPERRRQMGIASRKLAEERFSIGDVVAKHLAIYRELAK